MSNPLALDNPVALVLAFGPLAGSVIVENRRFQGDAKRRWADPTYRQLQAWQLAGLFLGVLFAFKTPGAGLPWNEWLWPALGCAIGLAGVALRWWAIRTLGAHFTRNLQTATDHRLITNGPYRHLRHPSYTGAILMLTGVGVGLGNALSALVCLLLSATGFVRRIPHEEKMLREELGEPYVKYVAQTRRLVPGVW